MKKVRFESPGKTANLGMEDSECHSPRPFIEKKFTSPTSNLTYDYPRTVQYETDPLHLYEYSNSSPYPSTTKTNLFNSAKNRVWSPSNELEISLLDATYQQPKQQTVSNFVLRPIENQFNGPHSVIRDKSNVQTKLPNATAKDNSFFILRDNIHKLHLNEHKPLHTCFDRSSLDKENNSPENGRELLKFDTPFTKPAFLQNETQNNLNDSCKCHHCIQITPTNFQCIRPCSGHQNLHTSTNMPKSIQLNQHVYDSVMPKSSAYAVSNEQCIEYVNNVCHCRNTQHLPKDAMERKVYGIHKYEQGMNKECKEIEKQRGIAKEKREPTVADLFKIIKLQSEQLQLLQEKVDKFITQNKQQSLPDQNYKVTEQVALENANNIEHKISIGVMTSFEMVRTSTVINREVMMQTKNSQIQCNRSHVSVKEVVKSQPVNLNFLEGITPVNNNKIGENKPHSELQEVDVVEKRDSGGRNANDDKTLNEMSLYNVQVDNAITPLMSPEQSLYLDIRDYSDSDTSSDDQSNVGWTYYNKVMTHVNGMLQDSDMPSSASALYRNTQQQCVQMQIDKTNVSVTKRVTFGDNPTGVGPYAFDINQPNVYAASTDTSMKMNQLAVKYLKHAPKPRLLQDQYRPKALPIDMSFATRNYMERHQILQGPSSPTQRANHDIPKFLDITTLKRQSKLL